MSYTAVHILCYEEVADTLSILLQERGYSGTSFENGRLSVFCSEEVFNAEDLNELLAGFDLKAEAIETLEDQNWNQVWEDNFTSSTIGDSICVRAPFQPASNLPYDIIVSPKMAFGTGHHPTTRLSALALVQLDCQNKTVLDMGCGSGVLAILASKMKAKRVVAIDYDILSVENAIENKQLNAIENVEVLHADSTEQLSETFDIVISNIVKNINFRLMPELVEKLNKGGALIVSGFLASDLGELQRKGEALNLKLINHTIEEDWLQALFIK